MVRRTGCETSDGCAAVVLERLVVEPGVRRREPGMVTLSSWLKGEADRHPCPAEHHAQGIEPEDYPSFELGSWRFTVKTGDLHLIEDLKAFVGDIAALPRADVKFTSKLVRCTEEGRLGGWAWQKERLRTG